MRKPATKPTRRDLLIVIGELQDIIGAIGGVALDDKSKDRAKPIQDLVARGMDLAVAARSFDPIIDGTWPHLSASELRAEAVENVVALLRRNDFVADGETQTETVRVPSRGAAPVLNHGKSGGRLRTIGGRQRYTNARTGVRVTVGTRTVYIYRVNNGQPETIARWDVADLVKRRGDFQRHIAIAADRLLAELLAGPEDA